MKKQIVIVLQAMLVLGGSGCAAHPDTRAYEIADFHARWLDRYQADRRRCERSGGVIVQERHEPDRATSTTCWATHCR